MKESYIYILTNKNKSTLYIGVTSDLRIRLSEHNSGAGSKFTKKYNLIYLVYFEKFGDINFAINREKQLKKCSRVKKDKLIETVNPNWDFIDF